jgi:hypothetical protein
MKGTKILNSLFRNIANIFRTKDENIMYAIMNIGLAVIIKPAIRPGEVPEERFELSLKRFIKFNLLMVFTSFISKLI